MCICLLQSCTGSGLRLCCTTCSTRGYCSKSSTAACDPPTGAGDKTCHNGAAARPYNRAACYSAPPTSIQAHHHTAGHSDRSSAGHQPGIPSAARNPPLPLFLSPSLFTAGALREVDFRREQYVEQPPEVHTYFHPPRIIRRDVHPPPQVPAAPPASWQAARRGAGHSSGGAPATAAEGRRPQRRRRCRRQRRPLPNLRCRGARSHPDQRPKWRRSRRRRRPRG